MMQLVLVRHGETAWNAEGRLQGHTDTPLNEPGKLQAGAVAASLSHTQVDAILSSPLQRAYDTAKIIASNLGIPPDSIRLDSRLRERRYGAAEGLTLHERESMFPDGQWPGAETHAELDVRVSAVLEELVRSRPNQSVVIVTHGGWIRSALRIVGGAKSSEARSAIPNCSCTWLRHDEVGWHIDQVGVVERTLEGRV